MSLSPDDRPLDLLDLPHRKAQVEQPYGLAAILIALAVLLMVLSLLGRRPLWISMASGIAIGLISYSLLTAVRPRLPLLLLAAVAAELGMLYSLPVRMLLVSTWAQDPGVLAEILTRFVGATVIGIFAGWVLAIDQYPAIVLPINFLLMFVVMNIAQFIH